MMMGRVCKRSRGRRNYSADLSIEPMKRWPTLMNQYADPTDGEDDQKNGQEIKGQGHLD